MVFRLTFKSFLLLSVLACPLYAQEVNPPAPLVLNLEDAVQRALQHNQAMLAAKYGVREAGAGVTVARSAFLPHISIQGSYTRLAEPAALEMATPVYGTLQVPVFDTLGNAMGYTEVPGIVGADTAEFQMGEEENYLARASLQQPLFAWGKILSGYQISDLNLQAVREDYRKVENELVFNVTKSFYGILVLEQLVELMKDAQEQTARHVEAVEKRYDEGLASRFDLLRARVQFANMEPEVVKVENGLELALTGFKTLLGFPQDTTVSLKGELRYEPTEVDLTQSVQEAKRNRPEVTALSLRKRMSAKALSIAKKGNWPSLALVANYDYKKPLHFENEWGGDWSVGIALQMPLFTGLETLGKMEEARSRLRKAEHGLKLLEEGVELEVRSACLHLEEAKRLVESQKENVTQAEEALKIVEERYKRGLATSLEVMDTQLALTQARMNQLDAVSDYIVARAEIERATGR